MKKLSLISLVIALVFVGSFAGYQIAQAVGGQGSANINGGVPGGNVTVERATSNIFTVVLTVGASGITTTAPSPTFTIPAGFTTPHPAGGAVVPSNASEVDVDGEWYVVGGSTCLVTMGSSGASGQVITVDVTTVCTVSATGIITLTYQGKSATPMGATPLNIGTAVDESETEVTYITAPPTITVTDTSVPTVTITDDESGVANIAGGTVTYTFTFSEAVTGFTIDDIAVVGGTKGAFTPVSGTVYTLVVTPSAMEGNMTVDVAGGVAVDAGANGNTAAAQSVQAVDTVAPTVTITMSDTALTVGETALVTFTFSEAPTGFDATDVILTNANGTIGAIDAGNPLIQTATFTPTNAITDATNVITVGTAWTDVALNTGVEGSSPNYTINTVASSSGGSSQPGTITVIKTVVNDNGRTKTVADFPLFVNGVEVVSGVSHTFPAPANAYTVTETSNANYTQAFSGACDSSGRITLSPGDLKICVITNDDIGAQAVSTVPPLIDVVKVPSPLALPAGPGPVTYTYTLSNIGTVPVTDITMVGDTCSPIVLASGDTNGNAKLEVNEIWVYKCSTTLSATHTNIVTTTGWANGISAVDIASATVVVGAPVVPPLIHVTKVPSPLALSAKGGMVTYTEKITNPGTVALTNVTVTDDKCSPMKYVSGDANSDSKLGTSETWVYTCQANLSKTTTNTATVSGDANGLTAKDYAIVTVLVAAPGLPNTGFAPEWMGTPWGIGIAIGILLILAIFFVTRRK
ncbi:MAG: Ig-like domain-containing protein [bacterium]|nr:Ig-like domain-containing protein [bacterium]